MNKADRLLEITRRMVKLEREIEYLKAEFHRLANSDVKAVPRPGRLTSIVELVRVLLASRPTEVFTADVVATEVNKEIESVRAALSKLCYSGHIRRVAMGRYVYDPPQEATPTPNPTSSG